MLTNLFREISIGMPSFSKGQRLIAEYLLNHYDKAAFMTAAKLGSEVGVSESTVVRFATQLGFPGYPEFSKAVGEAVKGRLTAIQRMEIADEQMAGGNLLSTVLTQDIFRIKKTLEQISPLAFNSAVSDILAAKNIYIVGVRSSSSLANFLGFYFNLIFDNVKPVYAESANEIFEKIIRIGSEDVMIAISFPRYSKRTVKAASYAALQGASVIAITDSQNSPLSPHAKHALFAKSDMASFVDSLVAPLSLINALIVAVSLEKKESLHQTFENLENLWEEIDMFEKIEDDKD